MRFIIFLIFCCIIPEIKAQEQLTLEDCEFKLQEGRTPPFYAIKEKNVSDRSGKAVFIPNGTNGWVYDLNGTELLPTSPDSSSIEFTIFQDGNYSVTGTKNGVTVSSAFTIFHVFVPAFTVSLVDEFNCVEMKVKVDNFEPAIDHGYPGNGKVEYWLSRNGTFRQTPITLPDYPTLSMEIPEVVNLREDRDQSATYAVKIVDRFGFEWGSAPVSYTSYLPLAKMELTFDNKVKVEGFSGEDIGQAPLEVAFRNQSQNAGHYEWFLYKDTADLKENMVMYEDSLIDNRIRTEAEFNYTYEHPGRYKVRLVAINDEHNQCTDTTAPEFINVVISLVNVPNVFTPNGDGINDVFRVQTLSIEAFEAVIINRWGRKVYEWTDPEGGWDGRINGKYANPGTYYYIVTARGREKSNTPRYVKKGPLLLVR